MGFFSIIKDAVDCKLGLANLHIQSEKQFYEYTGFFIGTFTKQVKST